MEKLILVKLLENVLNTYKGRINFECKIKCSQNMVSMLKEGFKL